MGDPKSESPRGDPIIPGIDGCIQRLREKTIKDLMAALSKMYEKPSASNKIFLMRKLFNLKMAESGSVAEHLNEFNTLTSQLESVEINFDDEIKALVLLSSMPEA